MFYEKNNKKDLEEKIEQKRKELYKIAKEKEFCSSEVLSCSKELDKLIVLFQKNFFKNNFGKE